MDKRGRPRPRSGLASLRACVVGGLLVLLFGPVHGQHEPDSTRADDDPWGPLRALVGTWEGAIDGKWGSGKGVRQYKFHAGTTYLQVRHSSVRLPQPATPDGDDHDEIGIFSFDRQRQTLVYREFLGEGYVTRYTCESTGSTVVCTSEFVENGPNVRSRLTLEIIDGFHFVEKFEIGQGNGELELWFDNRWTRVPSLDD